MEVGPQDKGLVYAIRGVAENESDKPRNLIKAYHRYRWYALHILMLEVRENFWS